MSLFQKSVVNKYLKNLNQQAVEEAYKQFQQFYDDSERIENIRLLKEENYQEGFLREIFVDVLGYTINPNKNYNLTTEYKNETDSKKADGAILHDGKAIGVIELKSTTTPNLESINDQAFNYKNHQSNCRFVITSNFEKLRFYIDNATDWEEFNLFHLDYDNFCKLYLYLNKENIFNGITAKLKEESKLHEEDVTGKLYNDYSIFKQQLFNDLIKNNPEIDKLLLFHKSQKLLDRILFILFAEDRGLLPPNAITKIVEQWKSLKELDEEKSLYSRFVKLFHHLDEGHKYKEYELPAYNGGLFKKDDVIDNLIISDEVLHTNSLKLSTYDFNTEVDVNILGHIFENSITEIEQVKAEIEGQQSDKNRSRRKKEGIFYTPKYITKYIVDNTIGVLCTEKKKELGINEIENEIIENSRNAKGKLTKKAESLLLKLNEYRDYLKSLKILDPACGSGAFLNQALEFLINEHEQIDSYRRELEQDSLGLYDITKSILENNLYGVDINEEAVEIAKLSLWIRTAERGRKLSDLSSNIKCGNSLIDDPSVAGDKAFNWVKEFPQVFKTTSPSIPLLAKEREVKGEVEIVDGGFDVVIGNPPYISMEDMLDNQKEFFNKIFLALERKYDSSIVFILSGLKLLRKEGYLSYISSISWQTGENFKKLRKQLLSEYCVNRIINLPFNVFKDAYVDTGIYFISNKEQNEFYQIYEYPKNETISFIDNNRLNKIIKPDMNDDDCKFFASSSVITLRDKFQNNSFLTFGDISISTQGLAGNKFIVFKESALNYIQYLVEGQGYRYELIIDELAYTDMTDYQSLIKYYTSPRIFIRRIINRQDRLMASYCDYDLITKKDLNPFIITDKRFYTKFILALLNSTLISYLYLNQSTIAKKDDFRQTTLAELRKLPIPFTENSRQLIIANNADLIMEQSKLIRERQSTFLSRIQSNFTIDKPSNKLKEFYNYDFKTFLSELKKKKITLTLKQQDEWEQYFNEYKTEINKLQQQINQTDKEIDQLVYKLYGLTEDEIKIVEESVK